MKDTSAPRTKDGTTAVELLAFAAPVAVLLIWGNHAGTRMLGAVTIFGALVQMKRGRIAYGIEGRAPSGYLTGKSAIVVSVLQFILGLTLIAKTDAMLGILGWNYSPVRN